MELLTKAFLLPGLCLRSEINVSGVDPLASWLRPQFAWSSSSFSNDSKNCTQARNTYAYQGHFLTALEGPFLMNYESFKVFLNENLKTKNECVSVFAELGH